MITISDELRAVEFCKLDSGVRVKGWFHRWVKKVKEDGSEYLLALVEDERGSINYAECEKLKFTDREAMLYNGIF